MLLRRGENPKEVLDGGSREGRRASTTRSCRGMKIVPFYDRTRAGRHDAARPCRTTCWRARRWSRVVVWLFLRTIRGSHRGVGDLPLALLAAFVGLYFAAFRPTCSRWARSTSASWLDGAVILVENAYRHLAREQQTPAPSAATCVGRVGQGGSSRPTFYAMAIIIAALMPGLHARARRGTDLPPARADLRLRAGRRARLHAHPGAGAGGGARSRIGRREKIRVRSRLDARGTGAGSGRILTRRWIACALVGVLGIGHVPGRASAWSSCPSSTRVTW